MTSEKKSPEPSVDATSPWVVDVARELLRRPGQMKTLRRDVPAPEGFGLEMVGVPVGEPIHLDLRLESVMEGVLASGTVEADVTGECSRCLEPFTDHVDVDLTELYAYPDSVTDDTADEDEVSRIVDERIDLEPAVRDAVLLELPVTPLCREDCPGVPTPDPEAWAFVPAGEARETIDPRWAALQEKYGGTGRTEN
ncbi:YceD family protein [Actinomycetospora straminea]|uniref:YceD family protein n=1 Tax=Actinomycetospora straminea TaxID=663607 RepID=A0ABP9EXT5_9PSEU|nr:YceD family protein [Actinomycetospora straminea]MDD7931767.1 YceD family protein [Actinomycetospora straminea]